LLIYFTGALKDFETIKSQQQSTVGGSSSNTTKHESVSFT
jgi:hypothetical protein